MTTASELRKKPAEELKTELAALFKEHFNLRVQQSVGKVSQTHLFNKVKKDIARIKTILREVEGS